MTTPDPVQDAIDRGEKRGKEIAEATKKLGEATKKARGK